MDQRDTEFVKSKRGGYILSHQGFEYHRTGRNNDSTYWICARRPECNARATTKGVVPDGARVTKKAEHAHAPNREATAARKVVNTMKEVATRHPEMQPANILRDGLADVEDGVLAQLPQRPALKRTLNRKRQADLPRNPLALGDIRDLPHEFQRSIGGKRDTYYLRQSLCGISIIGM